MKTALATFTLAIGCLLGLNATCFGQQSKTYGTSTPFRQEDYEKMFKMEFGVKTLEGYLKEFNTQSLEMKAAILPEYGGNLKDVPMTDWQSSKTEFRTKDLDKREFEIRKAVDLWSQPSMYTTDTAISTTSSSLDGRDSGESEKSVERTDLPPPYAVKNEDLQRLINHGSSAPTLKLGRGFGAKEIRGTTPKSEPSK